MPLPAKLHNPKPQYFGLKDRRHYDAGVISDLHLIKKRTNAAYLYEFLCAHRFDTLYLNGDIFDGWKMLANKHRDFPEMQKRVLDRIVQMAVEEGTRILYVPGNHDDRLREMFEGWPSVFDEDGALPWDRSRREFFHGEGGGFPVEFVPEHIFISYSGRRYLVMHGDQFDPDWLKTPKGIKFAKIADQIWHEWFQRKALPIDREVKTILRALGKDAKFSLAKYLQGRFESRAEIWDAFRKGAMAIARNLDLDGVICGHIHMPLQEEIGGVTYFNSGDWTGGASAVVFDHRGEGRVLDWKKEREVLGCAIQPPLPDEAYPQDTYRSITEDWIEWARAIWPARGNRKAVRAGSGSGRRTGIEALSGPPAS